jgi:hypothetical protein
MIIAVFFAASFTSCDPYEDGPTITLATKVSRASNTWILEKVLQNEVDVTQYYNTTTDYFEFTEAGTSIYYGSSGSFNGTWALDGTGDNITEIWTILFITSTDTRKILRLTSDEMWLLKTAQNGDKTEKHYKTK